MIAIAKTEVESCDESLQAKFLAMLPIIVRYARVAFRKLAPEAREEAIQETIAAAWTAFKRLADRGKLSVCFPTVLAMYSIKQVRNFRRVGNRLRIGDALSPYSQYRKQFVVARLDHFDSDENAWEEIVVADRRASPADLAATRIDFAAWLKLLPRQRRKIALALAGGETTSATARKFRVSAGRVSQLRLWLREHWLRFQGEANPDEQPRLAVA